MLLPCRAIAVVPSAELIERDGLIVPHELPAGQIQDIVANFRTANL